MRSEKEILYQLNQLIQKAPEILLSTAKMEKRVQQETALAIFKEIEKAGYGDGDTLLIFKPDYEKIKQKRVKK